MERLRKRIHPPKSGILEQSNDEDPTVHMCSFCDKKYSRADSLNDHVRAIHKKTIPCSICSMAFSSKQTLQRHQLTHTSERPHHCLTCGSSFKRRDALTYHEQKQYIARREVMIVPSPSLAYLDVNFASNMNALDTILFR